MSSSNLRALEVFALLTKVTEHILEIVQEEHPEIITRAIIKTMKGKDEHD